MLKNNRCVPTQNNQKVFGHRSNRLHHFTHLALNSFEIRFFVLSLSLTATSAMLKLHSYFFFSLSSHPSLEKNPILLRKPYYIIVSIFFFFRNFFLKFLITIKLHSQFRQSSNSKLFFFES